MGHKKLTQCEISARKMFEQRCREGIRPLMYALDRCANGEYVSIFTEQAWKWYFAGIADADRAF